MIFASKKNESAKCKALPAAVLIGSKGLAEPEPCCAAHLPTQKGERAVAAGQQGFVFLHPSRHLVGLRAAFRFIFSSFASIFLQYVFLIFIDRSKNRVLQLQELRNEIRAKMGDSIRIKLRASLRLSCPTFFHGRCKRNFGLPGTKMICTVLGPDRPSTDYGDSRSRLYDIQRGSKRKGFHLGVSGTCRCEHERARARMNVKYPRMH